jgi:hypothetical protein
LQNDELSQATGEVSRLQRSQAVVDTDETQRDQWLIALDEEIVKDKPSPALLSAAAHNALECTVRRESHMAERVSNTSDEYKQAIAEREAIEAQADVLLAKQDYKALIAVLNHFVDVDRKGGTASQDKKYFDTVDEANATVSMMQRRVRLTYLWATALLLLSSVLGSVSLDMTLRKITRDSSLTKSSNKRR